MKNTMKVLLGEKIEMSQLFKEDGTVIPVTVVKAGPVTVTNVHTLADGRKLFTIGYGTRKRANKAQTGDWKELGIFAHVQEFPMQDGEAVERGKVWDASVFAAGEKVDIVGTSKGHGFQGVVKRHGFHGQPSTHGHKDQSRKSGSIGAGGIQRVFRGMRMAGRMGNDRITVKNLEIVNVDAAKGLLYVKGAIPGARGSFVTLLSTDGNVWR